MDILIRILGLTMESEDRVVVVIVNVEDEGDGVHASKAAHSADDSFLRALEEWGDIGNGGVLLEVGDEEGVVFGSPGEALSRGAIW